MKLLQTLKTGIAVMLATALVACAALGVPTADTFNKKLLGGYATVTTVAKTAGVLRTAGKLSDSDLENVVSTNRQAIAGLDIAAATAKTDLGAAQTKLTATLTILTALESYLASQQGVKP
jgi:hypothetical protein